MKRVGAVSLAKLGRVASILVALNLVNIVLSQQQFTQVSDLQAEDEGAGEGVRRNYFGHREEIVKNSTEEGHFIKNLHYDDTTHFHMDYKQQAEHLEKMTAYLKGEKEFKELSRNYPTTCHSKRSNEPNPLAMYHSLPAWTGQLSIQNSKIEFEGNCFERITMELEYERGDSKAKVVVHAEKKREFFCSDFFLFANTEILHVEDFFFEGKHEFNIHLSSRVKRDGFSFFGLETYLFCEDFQDEILSTFNTVKGFIGGLGLHGKIPLYQPKVPEYMERANVEFLKWAIEVELKERAVSRVDINPDLI
mmetsp:Transcript_8979/g.15193  ORF Transcript_8979/g.15193 Transcript_8979/m.15193 type:complete len:306 (-) Transcript_8979:938-1855(-)